MNEEEKFVIKTLKDSQNTYIENIKVKKVELSTDEAKVVLNLIEKQQKELEQIEKEHKEENGRLRDRIKELEEEKENEFKRGFFTKVAENKTNILKIESQVIPKSLVREKMELLREHIQYSANPLSIDNSKYAIEILQELLEESDKQYE